jgi:polygalacturonase
MPLLPSASSPPGLRRPLRPALAFAGLGALALIAGTGAAGRAGARPSTTVVATPFYDVRAYGAAADGKTKCTEAIRRALAAASAAGGGTIYFGAGQYLTGPIHLASNTTLFVDAGAVVRFSQDFDDYLPMVRSRWEGTEVLNFSPLIYADKAENVAIQGRGVLDGQGQAWWAYFQTLKEGKRKTGSWKTDSKWQREFARLNDVEGPSFELPDDPEMLRMGFLRPPFIQLIDCKNVSIEGVTIRNSPFWTVNPVGCDGVNVRGVTIENPDSAPNTDGIDPDSCRNVHISDSHISVGDDCIAIKSGRDRQGRRLGRPAENHTITGCTMLRGHGGVVIGSEMSGGVRGVAVSSCVFDGTDRGIRIKSTRGRGGAVENVRISNVVMRGVRDEAITLSLAYTDTPREPVSARTPHFRNIHVSGVSGEAGQAGVVTGLPESPIEDVSFTDIDLVAGKGFVIKDAADVALRGVRIDSAAGPAVLAQRAARLVLSGVSTGAAHAQTAVLDLTDVRGAFVHGCAAPRGADPFVEVRGAETADIVLDGNDLGGVRRVVAAPADLQARITRTAR